MMLKYEQLKATAINVVFGANLSKYPLFSSVVFDD
jgi:hypothetical protein